VIAVLLAAMLAQGDTQPLLRWEWVSDNVDEIVARGAQHFWLTVVSVVVALVIAFPFAVLAQRRRWVIQPITWLSSILYTIPALALISLLLPITGLSLTTVAIPLISYNLLILFRNTLAGLDGVDEDVLEAASGMGLTERQLLWRVQIPLATPVIVAGVRIATVSSIGLVTIAALIGRGGFGQFILLGLNTFFWTPLVVGVVLSVAFAFAADLLLLGVQRWTTPWARAAGIRAVAT
jgi:osmoprotectant transport system permease protein